jgi:hypothetical protein
LSEHRTVLEKPVIGIMQPYYFPYEGYFSHIFNCSVFVLHDNVQYTKKGWINRNRILKESGVSPISLPLRRDPDSFSIAQRHISDTYDAMHQFRIIEGAYRKAPYWNQLKEFLPNLLQPKQSNLFDYLFQQVSNICRILEIETPITRSSDYGLITGFKGQDMVLELCKRSRAASYLNPSGGRGLYSEDSFRLHGIGLGFIDHLAEPYNQRSTTSQSTSSSTFEERLSILDTLAEVGLEETKMRVRTNFAILNR